MKYKKSKIYIIADSCAFTEEIFSEKLCSVIP